MTTKKQHLGAPEAEPYARIQFHHGKAHGTQSIHQAHCGLKTRIGGLKEDLSHVFHITAQEQKWSYKGTELSDDKNLHSYGVNDRNKADSIINVGTA